MQVTELAEGVGVPHRAGDAPRIETGNAENKRYLLISQVALGELRSERNINAGDDYRLGL